MNLNPIDPRTLPNLFAWYDAQNLLGFGVSLPADGVAVSQWNDLSGNARHLVQGTGANQPLFKTGVVNGVFPVVRYVDATDTMQAAVAGVVLRPVTVIAVFKNTEADDAALNRVATFNAQRIGLAVDWAAANAFAGVDDNAATVTSGIAGDITNFHVSSFTARGAGLVSSLSVDGTHISPAGQAGTNTNSNVDVAVAGFLGDVAEVLVFTGDFPLSTVYALEMALMAKWGLVSSYLHGR